MLATPKETLRKVTLNLLGSLPSQSHLAKVEQEGEAGLERVLTELLTGMMGLSETRALISDRLVLSGMIYCSPTVHVWTANYPKH